jgi:hypothetical protein
MSEYLSPISEKLINPQVRITDDIRSLSESIIGGLFITNIAGEQLPGVLRRRQVPVKITRKRYHSSDDTMSIDVLVKGEEGKGAYQSLHFKKDSVTADAIREWNHNRDKYDSIEIEGSFGNDRSGNPTIVHITQVKLNEKET